MKTFKKQCGICGNTFSGTFNAKYCSAKCKRKASCESSKRTYSKNRNEILQRNRDKKSKEQYSTNYSCKLDDMSPEYLLNYGKNKAKEYIISDINALARELLLSDVLYHHSEESLKRIEAACKAGRMTDNYIRLFYGVGGFSGPDMPYVEYDGRGMNISWYGAQNGGILPIKLTWQEVAKYYREYYDDRI